MPMLHWSRTPLILEPVAWGTLSLWALLRGMRRDRPLLLGVSALLLGWTVYYGMVGLLFVGVAMLLWLGGRLLEPGWSSAAWAGAALATGAWGCLVWRCRWRPIGGPSPAH